jgi:prepilin-type processing-associated H-X9-DG protein
MSPEGRMKMTVFCLAAFAAIGLGWFALAQIRAAAERERESRGRLIAPLAIVLAMVSIGRVVVGESKASRVPAAARCGPNLSGLGKAMLIYADDYDVLPLADRWCDLLVNHAEAAPKLLICPASGVRRGQSTYAMNASAAGRPVVGLPLELVLLYESSPGWNQTGGPELLSTENHEGMGCNVLFVDGHVEFVKANKLAELKWKVEAERPAESPAKDQP